MSDEKKRTQLTGAFYLGGQRLDTSHAETMEYVRSRFAVKPAQPVEAVDVTTGDLERALLDQIRIITQQRDEARAAHPRPASDPFAALAESVAERREDGYWSACSGCHETVDGQAASGYVYSRTLGCAVGGGCHECGGIGIVWHYFGDADATAPTGEQAGEVVPRMALGDSGALDAITTNEEQRLIATKYAVRELRLSNLDVMPFVNGWLSGYAQPRPMGVPDGGDQFPADHL